MKKRNYYKEHLERLEKGENLSEQDLVIKERFAANRAKYRVAAQGLFEDLHEVGCYVSSLQELQEDKKGYLVAIPVLIKWLPKIDYDLLKEDVVRIMTNSWAKGAAEVLIQEFQITTSEQHKSYRWAVGNALSVIAQKKHFPELASIVQDRSAGSARQKVMKALAKTKHPDASQVLIEALRIGDEVGHVLNALRYLKARVPKALVEQYLNHEFPWVRKEAKKLLALQDKLDAAET
ncbi:HEAT repeat domain-containing protein [Acanthopleuribacter pedis]|uniref:HEAT repeat domain-containing protein n=1 Tax=Acanthopleuribacter pedis TaxID=442870 RepID=A0A8J7QIA7_9BACT|nr:HEAT repeat domain-containing protein [Acanthopleuribacter pedis]MBO1320840.1 hypothetical protein [Acanthopleuribacter pedis]